MCANPHGLIYSGFLWPSRLLHLRLWEYNSYSQLSLSHLTLAKGNPIKKKITIPKFCKNVRTECVCFNEGYARKFNNQGLFVICLQNYLKYDRLFHLWTSKGESIVSFLEKEEVFAVANMHAYGWGGRKWSKIVPREALCLWQESGNKASQPARRGKAAWERGPEGRRESVKDVIPFKAGCRAPIKNGSPINVLVLSGMFCWVTRCCDLYTQRTRVDGWMKWSITLSDTFRAVQLHTENRPSFAPFCERWLYQVFQWNMCNFPFKLVPHEPWRTPQVSVVAPA